MMTLDDVRGIMAKAERNRPAVLAYKYGAGIVSSWGGVEVRAGNPFGLDSRLDQTGAPQPRNLFLVSRDVYEAGIQGGFNGAL